MTVDPSYAVRARPRRERVMLVLDPVVHLLVRGLARLGVDPLWVVTLHGLLGLAAAALIAFGARAVWPAASLLLLLRVLLDNADGALARRTGRVTRMGGYYDTGTDLVVALALFAALAVHAGPLLPAAGLVALVFLLSLDYNMDRLYRIPRTPVHLGPPVTEAPIGAPEPAFRFFRGLYDRLVGPLDRFIERLDRAAFLRLEGTPYDEAPLDRRLAWSDLFSVATITDLGLSTQTLVLAGLVLAGRPGLYPAIVLTMLAWALVAQWVRAWRYRAYQAADPDPDASSGHAG